jgi:hypothetical protein
LIAVVVLPWYERYVERILCLPVCNRAMRTAYSTASAPPLVKKTLLNPSGARSVMRFAAALRASLACCGAMVQSFAAWA